MVFIVNTTKARENFAEIINRVLYAGDEFIVKKKGKPAALITRIKEKTKKTPHRELTGNDFLLEVSKFDLKGPKDLAQNHDKYTWE